MFLCLAFLSLGVSSSLWSAKHLSAPSEYLQSAFFFPHLGYEREGVGWRGDAAQKTGTEMENENIDLYFVSGSLPSPWHGEHADTFLFASLSLTSLLYTPFFFYKAPHEICKEEHLLAMSWKRTSAGETVYNKCPTNATGQSHIRHHTSG